MVSVRYLLNIFVDIGQVQFRVKSTNYYESYGPFFNFIVQSICTKNGFHSISFENISVLDSYFVHRYIIIKCRSTLIKGKTANYYGLWPFFNFIFFFFFLQNACFQVRMAPWVLASVSY